MPTLSVTVDVPNLADGVRFYGDVFGFELVAEPFPGFAVLKTQDAQLCLAERPAGTAPSEFTTDRRRYERHWTPIHLDIHVTDFNATLERTLASGAVQEQLFDRSHEHGAMAFCSDPFGHGFCLLESRGR